MQEAHIVNNFSIELAQSYYSFVDHGQPVQVNGTQYVIYWFDIGGIKDNSNAQRISVDFGVQVASIIYGVDMNLNYHGFKIRDEYVRNSNHYMFPDDYPGTGLPSTVINGQPPRTGHKWAQLDDAWYITGKKDWKNLGSPVNSLR